MGNSNPTANPVIPEYLQTESDYKFTEEFLQEYSMCNLSLTGKVLTTPAKTQIRVFPNEMWYGKIVPEKTMELLTKICDQKLGGWILPIRIKGKYCVYWGITAITLKFGNLWTNREYVHSDYGSCVSVR